MSQSGVVSWSQTAASNGTADSNVNWAEGMAPSAVNNSSRGQMSSVAKYRDDTAGSLTTGGTTTAYTLTTNQVFSTLAILNGQSLKVRFDKANGASATLNVDTLGAKALQIDASTAAPAGMIQADSIWDVTYDNTIPAFILTGAVPVQTAMIEDSAVTYAKIQDVTDQRVLGNFTGGSAAPSEYSLSGPTVSGTTISFPTPPTAAFSNLSIKVATNTTVTVAADFVAMTDGSGGFITRAISATLNLGSNGAVNRLDSGTIAQATWYYIFAISDGSTHGTLASTSSTSPTMPSGYIYKARIGAVRTAAGLAQLLGTWQFGRRAQYVVGLAQTTVASLVMANGTAGTYSLTSPTLASQSVSSFVPSTAAEISLAVNNVYKGTNADVLAAPSTSWGGSNNGPTGTNGAAWPIWATAAVALSVSARMVLESTAIGWASSNSGGAISCVGWEDNI